MRTRLRAHRRAAALSQRQVAEKLRWSPSKIHRIEAGTSPLAVADLARLLDLYNIKDPQEFGQLQKLAGAARRPASKEFRDVLPASVRRYMDYESAARQIWNFERDFVPGLLQTSDYTRALLARVSVQFRDQPAIERAVAARTHRQRILDSMNPVRLDVLIDESVITRGVGGSRVMRGQLEHLWAMNERPNISVGIIPFSAGVYRWMRIPFVVMRFDISAHGDLLFLEDPVREVITREVDQESAARPSTYLETFQQIRALARHGSDASQRIRQTLRNLPPEVS